MIRGRTSRLVGMLACGLLIVGCGSASSSSSSSTSPPSTSSSTSTPATTTAPTAKEPADAQAEIAACRQTLATQSQLPAQVKAKLGADCVKAATGGPPAIKQATRELCEEIIKTSALPAGPTKQRALALCKRK